MRRRPTPKRECGKILTLLYEAWLCFLTLLVEGLPLKFNTGRCVCKFDTVTPEPKLVKIGHVTRKCITTCSLYVNVSLRQVTKCLNDVNGTYIPEPWGSGAFYIKKKIGGSIEHPILCGDRTWTGFVKTNPICKRKSASLPWRTPSVICFANRQTLPATTPLVLAISASQLHKPKRWGRFLPSSSFWCG
jgi:hypothetical protein